MAERNVQELKVEFPVMFDGDEVSKDAFVKAFDTFLGEIGILGYIVPCATISLKEEGS